MTRHLLTPEERARGGQTRAAQPAFAAHNAQIAPAGFAATAARYGGDFARRQAAAKRATAPSRPQAAVGAWLDAWGYLRDSEYWTEVQVWLPDGRDVYLDYIVITPAGQRLVVEIDGAHWHDPAADAARDAHLAALGYPTFRLDAEQVARHPREARRALEAALLRLLPDVGGSEVAV